MKKLLAIGALVLASAAASSPATAGDASQARRTFEQAAQAYREARYRDAIDLFRRAHDLDPHPELVFNIGQAYEKLGDVPNALRSFREYLRLSPGATDRPTVEASIRNLEQRLRDKGVQQVSVFSTPPGAAVALDGRDVGRTPWTGEIAPGRHVVVLRHDGFPDTAKEFQLASDRSMDIDIALGQGGSSSAARAAEAPAAPPAAKTPAEPGPAVRPLTIGVLAVGAAGLGAALAFEMSRRSAEESARSASQVDYRDAYDSMKGRQTLARVFLGVGAAATIAGGTLLVVDLRRAGKTAEGTGRSAPPARAGFGCAAGGCGIVASGSF